MQTLLVAEVGLNHMGSEDYANEYLAWLPDLGFDAIEFQVRESEFYTKDPERAALKLSDDYYADAAQRIRGRGVKFGVALSDAGKLDFFERIGTDFYKILSKDLLNKTLVKSVLSTGKPVYASTGTASTEEITSVVGEGGNLSLIHTQLSHQDEDVNLRAIARLREQFEVPVAFGLHSTTPVALYGAIGFAPAALFMYVKGSRVAKHRDEDHAIPLAECASVVGNVRRLRVMLGTGVKSNIRNSISDPTKNG